MVDLFSLTVGIVGAAAILSPIATLAVRSYRRRIAELLAQQDADTKAIVGHLRERERLTKSVDAAEAKLREAMRKRHQFEDRAEALREQVERLTAEVDQLRAYKAKFTRKKGDGNGHAKAAA